MSVWRTYRLGTYSPETGIWTWRRSATDQGPDELARARTYGLFRRYVDVIEAGTVSNFNDVTDVVLVVLEQSPVSDLQPEMKELVRWRRCRN